MSNNILTIDMITRKSLQVLRNELGVVRNVNRQYDKSFAVEGAKIGDTLRIRLPNRYLVSNGPALVVQDENEQNTSLKISSQKHIGLNFTTADLSLAMDDFSKRFIEPAMVQLAATIDADVAQGVLAQIAQSVGTPGTTPASTTVLLNAMQKLNESAAPRSPRYGVINPAAEAALIDGMKGLYNPADVISKQFKSGLIAENILGYSELSMSQSISQFTTGTRVNGTMAAAATQGATSLSLTGLGANATVLAGDVFTVAGTNAVNPLTRQSTGSLKQFVVLASVTASAGGAATVQVAPVYDASQALATVDVLPANGAAVTFIGGAGITSPQNLVYHQDAIAFATADLVMPQGVDMASRQQADGISLRIVRQYDINSDRMPCRVDVLYGYGVIRPELAVRMWG